MFNIKKKTNNTTTSSQATYDCYGPQAWQYQLTREVVEGQKLYGIKKKIGNTYRVLLPNCSHTVPAVGNFIEYNVTDIWLDDGLALINSNGRIIFQSLKSIGYISDKLIAIDKEGSGKYRLYNTHTCRLTHEEYTDFEVYDTYIQTFDEDLTGILNWDFEEELPAIFVRVYPFGNVFKGETTLGTEVIGSARWEKPSTEADRIFPEANGFFRAYSGTRYGFIRSDTGRNLTKFEFSSATDFEQNGIAQVQTSPHLWQYLDKDGKKLPKPEGEPVVL